MIDQINAKKLLFKDNWQKANKFNRIKLKTCLSSGY